MNEYREDLQHGLNEMRWTLFKGLPLFIIIVATLSAIGFGLNSVGLLGSTIVQREVFKASYQRSAALESQLANDNAVKASIESQLSNPTIDDNTRANLNAQLAAVRVRITTTKGVMK